MLHELVHVYHLVSWTSALFKEESRDCGFSFLMGLCGDTNPSCPFGNTTLAVGRGQLSH